jgi:hypothetical protein
MSTPATPQVQTTRPEGLPEHGEQALVPALQSLETEGLIPLNTRASRLSVELDVGIPLSDFRVRNLLALEAGAVVASQWGHGDDVPLGSGVVQLAWSEFEVVDTQLAVRLTRLV